MANTDKFTVWGNNSAPSPSYGTYPAENGFSAGNPIYADDFNSLLRAYSLLAVALGQKLIPGVNADTNPITINDTLSDVINKLNWLPNPITNGLAFHQLSFKIQERGYLDLALCAINILWDNKDITNSNIYDVLDHFLYSQNTTYKGIPCTGVFYSGGSNKKTIWNIGTKYIGDQALAASLIIKTVENPDGDNLNYFISNNFTFSNIIDIKTTIFPGVSQ